MAIKGRLIKEYISALNARNKKETTFQTKCNLQEELLRKLLEKAKKTQFGQLYQFAALSKSNNISEDYKSTIPVTNYEQMYENWWVKTVNGEKDVTWPGIVKYMALTSGTSLGATKRIPVTDDMIKHIRKTGFKHLCSISELDLPTTFFEKDILALGGSIMLKEFAAVKEGDLSGILTANLPTWLGNIYLPGNEIAKERKWDQKVAKIVAKAPEWDVAIIAGVPSWVLSMIQLIIDHYNLKTIHDIWPNFRVYAHGGVSIEPYLSSFDKVLSHNIYFSETYLASEGFFAYQNKDKGGMHLAINNGIYFEFLPFNSDNFDTNGNVINNKGVVNISEVEENVPYAMLVTTCAGTWRYMIGDTIKFVNKSALEIQITGRTKHFVNVCGEHLSIENLNEAIDCVNKTLETNIQEFAICSEKTENGIYHRWIIATDIKADSEKIKELIDSKLKENNADYNSVRPHSVVDLEVNVVTVNDVYRWMEANGKIGGQNKFPRVLTKNQYADFKSLIL